MEHEEGLTVGRMLVGRQASGLNCWQMSKACPSDANNCTLLSESDATQGHKEMLKSASRIGGKTGDEGGNCPVPLDQNDPCSLSPKTEAS